ncbi:MAG: glycosyltransferase family 9 protein [Deltaproteobacteria bacterium]|nr:glycosyltransferase family 9 protein [Deltaproteobacteria bacterium]
MARPYKERGNKLYRFLDRYVGIPLLYVAALCRIRIPSIPQKPKRIGILKTSCIGDTVLLDAISRDLRGAWPQARQIFFAGRDNSRIADLLEEIDAVIVLPMHRPWAAAKRIYEAGTFDLWLDFSQWARIDALLTMVARAKYKVGFKTPKQYRHYGYDISVEHRHDLHEVDNYRNLVNVLGVGGQALPVLRGDSHLEGTISNLGADVPYVVLHMFPGGSRAYMKEWPRENWLKVALFCLSRGWAVVLTGGGGDYERAQDFANELCSKEMVVNLAGYLPLEQLPSLLGKSKLVVSIDTGVMHMASAVGSRLIAIHGPTSPLRWGPLNSNAKVIRIENLTCSPCLHLGFEYYCDSNYCMQNISAEIVIDVIKSKCSAEC